MSNDTVVCVFSSNYKGSKQIHMDGGALAPPAHPLNYRILQNESMGLLTVHSSYFITPCHSRRRPSLGPCWIRKHCLASGSSSNSSRSRNKGQPLVTIWQARTSESSWGEGAATQQGPPALRQCRGFKAVSAGWRRSCYSAGS